MDKKRQEIVEKLLATRSPEAVDLLLDDLFVALCEEHDKELEAVQAVRDEGQKELVADLEEAHKLRERLASLLTKTAAALKGPPLENVLHDWSDLPRVAAIVKAVADAAVASEAALKPDAETEFTLAQAVKAYQKDKEVREKRLGAALKADW